jgi:hypothetical protein
VLTTPEKNLVAVAGCTVVEDDDNVVRIRHALTTDMTSKLKQLPTVTQIKDRIQKGARRALDQYVGIKFLEEKIPDVKQTLTQYLKDEKEAKIIGGFAGVTCIKDPDDPTSLIAEAYYRPVLPLLYILITFHISST